jgi:hypothetical protein
LRQLREKWETPCQALDGFLLVWALKQAQQSLISIARDGHCPPTYSHAPIDRTPPLPLGSIAEAFEPLKHEDIGMAGSPPPRSLNLSLYCTPLVLLQKMALVTVPPDGASPSEQQEAHYLARARDAVAREDVRAVDELLEEIRGITGLKKVRRFQGKSGPTRSQNRSTFEVVLRDLT